MVAKDDIRNYAPIESREDPQDKVSGRIPVVAYDMDTVADIGLIKLDALGLKTLSIISDTLSSIRKRTGRDINLSTLPLDDQNIYGMLNEGYTKGVFQAEAVPYTNLLKYFDELGLHYRLATFIRDKRFEKIIGFEFADGTYEDYPNP